MRHQILGACQQKDLGMKIQPSYSMRGIWLDRFPILNTPQRVFHLKKIYLFLFSDEGEGRGAYLKKNKFYLSETGEIALCLSTLAAPSEDPA